jgi:hypothetical protein
MSRQGQFIRLMQREKQVIETIYLPGPIIKRIVHWSGTGSKGNCMPEKTLIGEVVGLFLGNALTQQMPVDCFKVGSLNHYNR